MDLPEDQLEALLDILRARDIIISWRWGLWRTIRIEMPDGSLRQFTQEQFWMELSWALQIPRNLTMEESNAQN